MFRIRANGSIAEFGFISAGGGFEGYQTVMNGGYGPFFLPSVAGGPLGHTDFPFALAAKQVTYVPTIITGAGSGSTNYTLQTDAREMILGSSNINIVAAMQTVAGMSRKCTVMITNDSVNNWGVIFQSQTNRWFFQGLQGGGTNAPTSLTNNTRLVLEIDFFGTNGFVQYNYYRPAK
jgi:hypothetical protein